MNKEQMDIEETSPVKTSSGFALDKHISVGNIISLVAIATMFVTAYSQYRSEQAELKVRVEKVEERARDNSAKIELQRSELLALMRDTNAEVHTLATKVDRIFERRLK